MDFPAGFPRIITRGSQIFYTEVPMFSAVDIIDMALQLEKNGEDRYRAAISQNPSHELKQLLDWMANEESKHAQWFAGLKTQIEQDREMFDIQKMHPETLRDIIGNQSFSLDDVKFSAVCGQDELIRMFIEFENDTILFYNMLKAFITDPGISAQLDDIILEEQAHVAQLTARLVSPPTISLQ
jgi:rubrerythrin